MIYSMTGYAVLSRELPQGALNFEIRSVNHRYLDIQFRLPDELRSLELPLRELLAASLSRGKVDCRVGFVPLAGTSSLGEINAELLGKLVELNRSVRQALPDAASLSVADVLRWPGLLGNDRGESVPAEDLHGICMELMRAALMELNAARQREGEKLKELLQARAEKMRDLVALAAPRIPALLAAFESKLAGRLQEALGSNNDERVRQEISLFASKIDIDEELSRLSTHLTEVERVLQHGGAVGKRLDFLMQELNREANTLGAKSADAEISRISMALKVLIEQMREQVQNIE